MHTITLWLMVALVAFCLSLASEVLLAAIWV